VLPDDKNAVTYGGGGAMAERRRLGWPPPRGSSRFGRWTEWTSASPPSSDRSVIDVPQATAIVTLGIVIAVAPSSIPGLT
jgi:hypothetical protein